MKPGLRQCRQWLAGGFQRLVNAVPGNCSLCRQVCSKTTLCELCEQALPWLQDVCPRCALPLIDHCDAPCGYCATHPPAVDRCLAPLHYAEPVDSLVSGFKFHARFGDGRSLALLLASAARQGYADDSLPDLLVPMPLHRQRWRQRGYNQAIEVARTVSRDLRDLKVPLCTTAVTRQRATAAQTSLQSIAARRRNVAGAFTVVRPDQLQGVKHVAIVDDVITTMATVNALATCLRKLGIGRVDAWCLARASRHSGSAKPAAPNPPTRPSAKQLVNNSRGM